MKADIKKTKNNQQFSGKGNKKKNKKKTATCGRIYCSPLLWKKIYKDIKGSPFLCFTWYSLTLFVILPCYTGNYCAHGICVSVRLGRWNTLSQAEGPLLIYYQEGKKGSMAGFLPFFLYIYIRQFFTPIWRQRWKRERSLPPVLYRDIISHLWAA